jgi:hypothetical protein
MAPRFPLLSKPFWDPGAVLLVSDCQRQNLNLHTAVQIDNDLQARSASPANSLVQILKLAVNVLITVKV